MSHCPSCGRYVGPYEACPYCGARLSGRLPIRVVKIAALVLATVGLAALWFAAVRAEAPVISVDQAGATMNMAYVRVEGWVVRSPTFDEESGYLAFTVGDGSGAEMRVNVYRQQSEALRAASNLPALGDRVSVAGTLRVREDNVAMTLNVPEHLRIVRPDAEPRQIGSITADDQFRRVRVRGQVWAVSTPYEGLTLITLRDASGTIDVAVDESLQALTGALLPLEMGQSVEVTAAVSLYRDTPQLVPASVVDVRLLAEEVPVAEGVSIGNLSTADAGRMVIVEGRVTEVDPFSAGVKFGLDDGTGRITVLLWQDIYSGLPITTPLTAGAQARVMGEVSIYRGALEVLPQRPIDVTVLAAGETLPPARQIATLGAADVGATVTVVGNITRAEPFSRGQWLWINDGTSEIQVVVWDDIYQRLSARERLQPGARVQVTGKVQEYRGALELVPPLPTDVVLLEE